MHEPATPRTARILALLGTLVLARSAVAQVVLGNVPLSADGGFAECFTDSFSYAGPNTQLDTFTFPTGLSGEIRSSAHPPSFTEDNVATPIAYTYQVSVTAGAGRVTMLSVPFRAPLSAIAFGGGEGEEGESSESYSVHILPCGDPAAGCDEGAAPESLNDPGNEDVDSSPLSAVYPTGGSVIPTSSAITVLTGGTYVTGFAGLAAGEVSRVFAVASTLPGTCVVTVTLIDDAGGTATTNALAPCNFCGNGAVDDGEQCDDGNLGDGDCCSSGCQFEPDGSPCTGRDVSCGPDLCQRGACTEPIERCEPIVDGQQTGRKKPAVRVTCVAEGPTGKRDTCTVQGFADPEGDPITLAVPHSAPPAQAFGEGDGTAITQPVTKRFKKKRSLKLKLKLNPIGKALLNRRALERKHLDVAVRVVTQKAGQSPSPLLLRLIRLTRR